MAAVTGCGLVGAGGYLHAYKPESRPLAPKQQLCAIGHPWSPGVDQMLVRDLRAPVLERDEQPSEPGTIALSFSSRMVLWSTAARLSRASSFCSTRTIEKREILARQSPLFRGMPPRGGSH